MKRGPDRSSAPKTLSFSEMIAKIGPVDIEIIVLRAIINKIEEKKKEVNANKIYSLIGKQWRRQARAAGLKPPPPKKMFL